MKAIIALLLSVTLTNAFSQELLPSGTAENDALYFRADAAPGHTGMSFQKDGIRNGVKLEILKFNTDKEGLISIQAPIYIGGSKEFPRNGFHVKPNTKYQFSFDLKGQGERVFIGADELMSADFWTARNALKLTGKTPVSVTKEWTAHTVAFTTGDKARRVVLHVNFYGHEKYKSLPEKPGDYFMLSNIVLKEVAK